MKCNTCTLRYEGHAVKIAKVKIQNKSRIYDWNNETNEKQCQHRTSTDLAQMGHVRNVHNVPNDAAFSKIKLTTCLDAVSFGTFFFINLSNLMNMLCHMELI